MAGFRVAFLALLLAAPALAGDEPRIELRCFDAPRPAEELEAALRTLIEAKAAGVITEADAMTLKAALTRQVVISGVVEGAPVGTALLRLVGEAQKAGARVSLIARSEELERLSAVKVTAVLGTAPPADAVRVLLTLAEEQEDERLSVEWEEQGEGVFVVRVHPVEEGEGEPEQPEQPRPEAPPLLEPPPPPGQPGPRAWLGVGMAQATPAGVQVTVVTPGSPASEAGVEVGDVIVRLGSRAIATPADLAAAIQALGPGVDTVLESHRPSEVITTRRRVRLSPPPPR